MGLSLEKLFEKWEEFCYDLDLSEVDYWPTVVDGVMDVDEMFSLYDATIELFQERTGYSQRTINRIYCGVVTDATMDIWFKEPWRKAGYTTKEDEQ